MSRNKSTPFSKSKSNKSTSHNAAEVVRKGPPKLFADTIAALIDTGAAVMLGATRDGGTVVVTLLDGETREKEYVDNVEDWRQVLTDLAAWSAPDDSSPF